MKGSFTAVKAGLPLRRTRLVIALALLCAIEGTDSVSHAAGASIHVDDLSAGREIRSLSGHNRPTTAIAVSADGSLALTASLTPELRLWSIQDGREVRSIGYLNRKCDGPPGFESLWRGYARFHDMVLITNLRKAAHAKRR
jgi:hypothetical protein